jgi:CRISPR-associated protein Cas2
MLVIVTYDMAEDKRREKIASKLKNFGQRVQKSVFECFVDDEQISELKNIIDNNMDFGEDNIRYYYLCKKDEKNIEYLGKNVVYRDEDYFMI